MLCVRLGDRAFDIDPPSVILRHHAEASPYRGENSGPGPDGRAVPPVFFRCVVFRSSLRLVAIAVGASRSTYRTQRCPRPAATRPRECEE